jgi:hypothetical protein
MKRNWSRIWTWNLDHNGNWCYMHQAKGKESKTNLMIENNQENWKLKCERNDENWHFMGKCSGNDLKEETVALIWEEILSCPNSLMLDLNLSFLFCCLLFIQIKKIGWWRIKLHPLQFNLDMRGSALHD